VEVRDDEIGVVQVHVDAERRGEEPGQAADEEQPEERDCPDHRRLQPDRAFGTSSRPS
jgi:hypothetical protein